MDWPDQAPEEVTIKAGPYRATVASAIGGRLTSLTCDVDGQEIALIVPMENLSFPPRAWPKAGGFPMVPFANRLPAGRYQLSGKEFVLSDSPDGEHIHGFGHRRAWKLKRRSESGVQMEWLHDGRSDGWPWAFRAELGFSLSDAGCKLSLALTNLDSAHAMPMAVGWHPYHPYAGNGCCQNRLLAPTTKVWALNTAGAAFQTVQENVDHIEINPATTVVLGDWQGRARWAVPDSPFELLIETSGFKHAVLHRPPKGDYLCVEPVAALPGQLVIDAESLNYLPSQETAIATWRCALGHSRIAIG